MGFSSAAVLAWAAAGSAAVTAYSAYSQGQTSKKTGDYNATVARNKAIQDNGEATANVEQQRTKARAAIGQQLAATSESGTGLSGSNLDILNQSIFNNEADSLNIRYRADTNSGGLNAQAGLDEAKGSAAETAGYLNAAGSLLDGYSDYTRRKSSYLNKGTVIPNDG